MFSIRRFSIPVAIWKAFWQSKSVSLAVLLPSPSENQIFSISILSEELAGRMVNGGRL
jgi:hypothetical protein